MIRYIQLVDHYEGEREHTWKIDQKGRDMKDYALKMVLIFFSFKSPLI